MASAQALTYVPDGKSFFLNLFLDASAISYVFKRKTSNKTKILAKVFHRHNIDRIVSYVLITNFPKHEKHSL